MGNEGDLQEDHVWDVVFFFFPQREPEFNETGSTGREMGRCLSPAIPAFQTTESPCNADTVAKVSRGAAVP